MIRMGLGVCFKSKELVRLLYNSPESHHGRPSVKSVEFAT